MLKLTKAKQIFLNKLEKYQLQKCMRNGNKTNAMQKQLTEMFYKKGVLKNFAICKFTGKHLCFLAQVFSYEFQAICKNIFLTEHHWAAASDNVVCRKICSTKDTSQNRIFKAVFTKRLHRRCLTGFFTSRYTRKK